MNLFVLVVLVCQTANALSEISTPIKANKVNYLEAEKLYKYEPNKSFSPFLNNDLHIYCYGANNKTIRRMFETVVLRIYIEGDDYKQYDGLTPEEVEKHYDEHQSLFSYDLFSQKRTRLELSPFVSSCLGMDTQTPYTLKLKIVRLDVFRIIQLLLGCLIFKYASKLSHNAIFYYITGIVLGICSSFMLIIWLTSKLIPKRPVMYGVLIGGWAIGLWMVQLLWENMQVIIITYKAYVFWYIVITGSTSFLLCYRWGPPTNQRSKKIVKWLCQLASLEMIYLSSHNENASCAIMILVVIAQCFPKLIWYKCRSYWLRKSPPRIRLLTKEEYDEQGVRETAKALDGLRKYATSPDCKQWKVMTTLRDPYRFAAFVNGSSHIRYEELLRFESYTESGNAIDDDGSDVDISMDEDENEENVRRNIEYSSGSVDYNSGIVRASMRNSTFENEPSTSARSARELRQRQLTPSLTSQQRQITPLSAPPQRSTSRNDGGHSATYIYSRPPICRRHNFNGNDL
uniref:Nuclear envelope integral membrane protein 1 n=1 Tax=Glossina brevipalpis TaxID=37001 RepID=A0A1A9X553_9MUSC